MNIRIFTCFLGIFFVNRDVVCSFKDKIINSTAISGEFPFIAALVKKDSIDKINAYCVGAIISDRHIVTTGHCVRSKRSLRGIQILTGTHNLDSGGNIHKIKQIFIHPKYTGGGHNDRRSDIAILSLTIPMVFNHLQNSIKLSSKNIEHGLKGIIIGWSLVSSQEINFPTELQKLNVKIYHAPICQTLTTSKLYSEQICSIPTERSSTCNSAGGGILIVNEELAGLVSYEKFPCGYRNPIFCTKIYSFRTFILNVMKKI